MLTISVQCRGCSAPCGRRQGIHLPALADERGPAGRGARAPRRVVAEVDTGTVRGDLIQLARQLPGLWLISC
jgi:hypothetical protein